MTDTTQHHTSQPEYRRPPAFVNQVISTILRSPLHWVFGDQLMLVTFTGRKTGKQYTTPVTKIPDGANVVFFTRTGWWKNLRNGAPVTLLMRGRLVQGVATTEEDKEVVLREAKAYIQRHGLKNAWRIGIQINARRPPTEAELADLVRDHVLIRVTPLS